MLIQTGGPRDWRLFFWGDLKVLFNGEPLEDVIEADDVAGYLIRHRRDAAGKRVLERGFFATERMDGKVEFIGTRRFSPDDAKAAAQQKRDRRAARNLRHAAAQGGAA